MGLNNAVDATIQGFQSLNVATGTWTGRTLTPGTGISITNQDGTTGDPVISVSGSVVGETITGQSGGALSPTAGNWNIYGATVAAGTTPVATSGSVSTLTTNIQISQAIASTDATKIGLANFNSAQFTVDANGFVSLASGGITTIDGDTGSITGSTVTIYADNAANNCGTSVLFANSGTKSTFNVTDSNQNTLIGQGAGSGLTNVVSCTALGYQALASAGGIGASAGHVAIGYKAATLHNGQSSVAIGYNALASYAGLGNLVAIGSGCLPVATGGSTQTTAIGNLCFSALTNGVANTVIGNQGFLRSLTGANNIGVGFQCGSLYTGAESSNIVIGNVGVVGESNVLRLGTNGSLTGQQNLAFIAGITGATPTSANTPQVTLTDNTSNLTTISSGTAGFVLTSNGTATPTFQAPASQPFVYTNVTHAMSPYTVLGTDNYLSVDCSLGVVTLNFPNAPAANKTFIIKDRTGSAVAKNITLTTPGGTVTFDGSTSYVISTNFEAINLLANSTPTYEVF